MESSFDEEMLAVMRKADAVIRRKEWLLFAASFGSGLIVGALLAIAYEYFFS